MAKAKKIVFTGGGTVGHVTSKPDLSKMDGKCTISVTSTGLNMSRLINLA